MKKFLSFLLVSLFVLVLSGCSFIPNTGDDDAIDSLEITQEESQAKLEKLEKDGYLITFNYNDDEGDSGSFTLGAKDNVVWFISDGNGSAILEDGNNIHCYEYSTEEGYTFTGTVEKDQEESLVSVYKLAYTGWLYWANSYNGQLKKGSDAKVAGRSCYTYDLDLVSLTGIIGSLAGISGLKYKIYVDKELGITLKVEFAANVEGESSSFSYEVTEFLTGSSVVAPNLPEPTNNSGMSESYAKARNEFYLVTGVLVPQLEGLEAEDYPYEDGDTSYCFDIIEGEELSYDTFLLFKIYLDSALTDWECSGPTEDGEYTNVNYTSDSGGARRSCRTSRAFHRCWRT